MKKLWNLARHVVALWKYAVNWIYLYSVLCRRHRDSDANGRNSFPDREKSKLTDEQQEITDLKKRLRDSELERYILKKAFVYINIELPHISI